MVLSGRRGAGASVSVGGKRRGRGGDRGEEGKEEGGKEGEEGGGGRDGTLASGLVDVVEFGDL